MSLIKLNKELNLNTALDYYKEEWDLTQEQIQSAIKVMNIDWEEKLLFLLV